MPEEIGQEASFERTSSERAPDTTVILKVSGNTVQVLRDGMIRNYSALNLRPVFDDED